MTWNNVCQSSAQVAVSLFERVGPALHFHMDIPRAVHGGKSRVHLPLLGQLKAQLRATKVNCVAVKMLIVYLSPRLDLLQV